MDDKLTPLPAKPPPPPAKPVEVLAREKGTPGWHFAGAKALRRWDDGQAVTSDEFDAAIAELLTIRIR